MAKHIAGKLEVVGEIERGDGIRISQVRHPLLDALLTVTTLPAELTAAPALLADLQDAVHTAVDLRHGHIVQVVDLVEDAGHYQLVEAFVPGEPLDHVLRTAGRLPPADALLIARQVADALAYAHAHGLVHGRVTPASILVEQGVTPRAMLTGFATARLVPAGLPPPRALLAYCAPELLKAGQATRPDPRADVFALGLVLFEMLEGRAFFDGVSEEGMLERLRDGSAPLLPQFTHIPLTGISALVARAIRRGPAERTRTMEQMGREIEACLQRLATRKYTSLQGTTRYPMAVVAGPRPTRKITLPEMEAEDWDIPTMTPALPMRPRVAERPPRAWHTAELAVGGIAAALLVVGLILILRPPRLSLERAQATPRPVTAAPAVVTPPPTLALPASVPSTLPVHEAAIEENGAPAEPSVAAPRLNQAPRIVSSRPAQGEILTVREGSSIEFSARATDDDPDDRPSYAWFLGGREVSRRERWRFAVPSLATATAHTVELRVADTAGAQAPRLTWSIQVSPRISEDDAQAWLGRYEAAWEQKDLATLRRFGVVTGDDAAAELERWLRRQKGYRVAIDNAAIRTDGSHASVTFDRTDFDEDGSMLGTKRESFALEKQADGSVTARMP